MGLFSFGSKNKQDTVRDSGHFVKDDDADYGERARAKRASHAGEGARRTRGGADPILPEKKRARRRLVGAIALALAAAVGLPMLLDSEPKPLGADIAINIPSKEKAAPLPVPVAATVDSGEEIVELPPEEMAPAPVVTTAPAVAQASPPATVMAAAPADPPPLRTLDTARPVAAAQPAPKPEAVKPEPKREPVTQAPPRVADLEAKKLDRPVAKPAEARPVPVQDDAARALAILEGKPVVKATGPSQKYVVQVAALATQQKVDELQGRLRAAGVASFTERSGDLIRVRVGPYTREEGEKIRSKLIAMGLSGSMVPL